MAFDVLYCNGRDLSAARSVIAAPGWKTSSPAASWYSPCGGLRRTGWRRGSRGRARVRAVVAEDEASAYVGGATKSWLKVKQQGWIDADDRWRRRIFGVVR
jgi:hypothetical protein